MANQASKNLVPSKAPNLPVGPIEYSQSYQNELLNVLRLYFNQVDNFTQNATTPASGTTANRPVSSAQSRLAIGQFYFDTTLGYPIWWNGTVWKNASGTTV